MGNTDVADGNVHVPDLEKVTKVSCGMPNLEALIAKEAHPSTTVEEFDVFILPNRPGSTCGRQAGGLAG